ncbi:MAG TPA: hypothetical protein VFW48_00575 [Solirubrobacterales bacterium]|nr:hypothetical protein [Solirubrobacterales bacterium]
MSGQGQGGGGSKRTATAPPLRPSQISLPVLDNSQAAAGKARCYRCGESKPVSEFAKDRSKASGYKSICKDCDRAKSRRYYTENGERVRARINSANAAKRGER